MQPRACHAVPHMAGPAENVMFEPAGPEVARMSEAVEPDPNSRPTRTPIRSSGLQSRGCWHLRPGLITGASDDDPSGIATYSQAGAQTGFALLWLMPFTYPLMAVTQEISARTRPHHRPRSRRQYPPALPSLGGPQLIALLLSPTSSILAPISAPWAMWCTCWRVARPGLSLLAFGVTLRRAANAADNTHAMSRC